MNEALREYMLMKRPRVKKALTEAAEDMTDQQQLAFLQQLQLGDTEFQIGLAPYLPEGSEIDVSKGHLIPLPEDMREHGLSVQGVTRTGTDRERDFPIQGRLESLSLPGNAVSILGAVNANPQTWAHEYRHLEDQDYLSETNNRILDVFASRTKSEFQNSIGFLANMARASAMNDTVDNAKDLDEDSEDFKKLESRFKTASVIQNKMWSDDSDLSINELNSDLEKIFKDPVIAEKLQSVKNLAAIGNWFKKPAIGPMYEQFVKFEQSGKKEKERKQKIKDEGYEGAGYLPIDFREGGRSKLI